MVSVVVEPQHKVRYQYEAQLPYDEAPAAAVERRRRFWKLYESPESMRDAVLADIEQLRRIAADQIARGERVGVTDYRNAQGGEPPLQMPASMSPPSAETQKQLLHQASEIFDSQQKLVQENYEAMYAAITKALPLKELPLDKFELP